MHLPQEKYITLSTCQISAIGIVGALYKNFYSSYKSAIVPQAISRHKNALAYIYDTPRAYA